ncbi:MAG TPA: hypothetical protein VN259_07440 [Xanthomonadales bacterium]|nr:hypothetical protein [Xanthomonadales bacterium]
MGVEYKPVRYVVLNEHSLAVCGGYVADGWAQVLAGDKDGHSHLDGVVHLFGREVRDATPADFKRLRVSIPPDDTPHANPGIAIDRRAQVPRSI